MLSKLLFRLPGAVVLILLATYTTFQVSPWPSVLLMRRSIDGISLARMLEGHAPPDIRALLDERYDANDADALLDVFYPSKFDNSNERLPTIVWIHGGAWVTGDKRDIASYLKILAARGYAAVGVNYSLAPRQTYPTAL